MPLLLDTAPTLQLINVSQAKKFCRIDDDDSDAILTDLIAGAVSTAEAFLQMSLLPTIWRYTLDGFPACIVLPIGPVLTTDALAITYVDSAGASQPLASSDYQIRLGESAEISPGYSKSWPATQPGTYDAVTVTFTAGYASAAAVPAAIKQGVRLIIGDFYENRENTVLGVTPTEMPLSARNLLMPFVRHN